MLRALTPLGRLVIAVLVVALGGTTFLLIRDREPDGSSQPGADRIDAFASDDPLERACDLPERELIRLWRGYNDVHSEDITTVPNPPNYSGSFGTTSHSGPWDYVQTIPLVLYGPGNIADAGQIETQANITDVYPTAGVLTGVELPTRKGKVLSEALVEGAAPKLIVTVVWDGVGRNVLEEWPGRWPTVERLERLGTSYVDATVGSSPSITPAIHSNLGTGAYPRQHGVTAIGMRREDGSMGAAFKGKDPSDLDLTTFADEIDLALGNEPKVGMLAWKSWHQGMLGHGAALPGGDEDEMALIGASLQTLPGTYSLSRGITSLPGVEARAEELDLEDGEADGKWRGHAILDDHDSPAWVRYETDVLLEMLEQGDYGADDVPDLFFTNYKPTDIVSHRHNIYSEEMEDVLEAQDAALARLVEWLDSEVGDYVVVLTADHGNTPPAQRSGGWPLLQGQLEVDVNARFDIPAGRSLLAQTTAAGPFLNDSVLSEFDVAPERIARFLNRYTIGENWPEDELPEGYEDRADEPILAAAFVAEDLPEIMRCAFGKPFPPKGSTG